jgi:zinc protease
MLLALLFVVTAAAPPKPFTAEASIEGVSEYRLPNGLRVLLVPDGSKPSVTVNLTVFVGSRHENYGERGMAHLFEHMLFKKTKRFPDVKAELTKLGGNANGTTWYDRTNYFESFPADDDKLDLAISLESERLRSAIISRSELATEMTVVRNELEMGENDPDTVLEERIMSQAFLWHNYGNSTIGPRSDIEKVPNERLLAFYETYYQPDNAMLVIAGKFDEARAFKSIAKHFGKLAKPKRVLPTTYTEEPTQDGEVAFSIRRTGGAPVIAVGYHTPPTSDADAAPVEILTSVLADEPSGRLYKALVETKKAAKVGCNSFAIAQPMLEHGFVTCSASLQGKDSVSSAKDALFATLDAVVKQPPTQEEVERAKSALLKQFDLLLSDSSKVGVFLSEYAAAGDWRLLFLSRDRVAAVTPQDVQRVAQRYFKLSNRTFGEYVPTETPSRAEIPPLAALEPLFKDYKGRAELAQGEVFDVSPKNIDARTKKSTLTNGAKVAVLEKRTRGAAVHLSIALSFGDELSLRQQRAPGLAAANLVFRGTKKKTREQVKDAFDQLRAEVKVQPIKQGMLIAVEAHQPELERVIDLIAESLQEPALDGKELEALKRETIADAEQQKDDPMQIGMRSIQRVLHPVDAAHYLYVPTWDETIAETQALSIDKVREFHARFFGAAAARIAVVGDCDAGAVEAQLQKRFGGWTAKVPFVRIPTSFNAIAGNTSTVQTPDKAMAFFGAVTNFQLKDSDPDYPALLMADFLLGGGFLNGRIPQRLREKEGLSYGAGTFAEVASRDDTSVLVGYAIYAPQNVKKIQTGFVEEIVKAINSGFTKAELEQARTSLLKEREQLRAQDEELSVDLTRKLDLDRPMSFEQQVDDRLRTLTQQEVAAALKKYIDPKRLSQLMIGDFKKTN